MKQISKGMNWVAKGINQPHVFHTREKLLWGTYTMGEGYVSGNEGHVFWDGHKVD
jgi:hypothetical protein